MSSELIDTGDAREEAARVLLAFDVDDEDSGKIGLREDHDGTAASYDMRIGHRHNESTAGAQIVCLLSHDFVGEVPGQQHDIVRAAGLQFRRRDNGNADARHHSPLFERADVGDEVEKVGADATIVDERCALGRSAVGGHRMAFGPKVRHEVAKDRRKRTHLSAKRR